jgi:hypothetical protein
MLKRRTVYTLSVLLLVVLLCALIPAAYAEDCVCASAPERDPDCTGGCGTELELMRKLDVMICMDSANQHLSSLVGLRAVSVWCGTHPMIGFAGWKQKPEDIVQRNDLRCSPCTCHGTNHCRYGNFACRDIKAETIVQQI